MHLFLIWHDEGPEMKIFIDILEKNNCQVVYWVGAPGGEKYKPKHTIFHEHLKALANLPAPGVETDDFYPPSRDLIQKLYRVESLFMSMKNNRLYSKTTLDERRHIYYNIIQYWSGVILKYRPEAIVFFTVPHTLYNYIIYELAQLYGIKTIMFEDTWVSDRSLLYNDFWYGSQALKQEIEKNKDKNFSIKELSQDLSDYYESQINKVSDPTPVYAKAYQKQYKIFNRFLHKLKLGLGSFSDLSIFKKFVLYIYKLIKKNIKREYYHFQENPDLNKKYIYFPLNYQPERTTSPQGDMFVDQILVTEMLSASLPDDWVIYIKEHPTQWLFSGINYTESRYEGYYKRLAQIKKVRLVPIDFDTYKLINKAQAVATVTGTAGWEALLRSKPVVIFGYPWYRDCPGVFRVDSVGSCRQVWQKIKEGYKIDQQKIINYLKSLDKASIRAYVEIFEGRDEKLTKQMSTERLAEAIVNNMKE